MAGWMREADRARISSAIETGLLPHTVTVRRPERVSDGAGGVETSMEDVLTDAPARISPLSDAGRARSAVIASLSERFGAEKLYRFRMTAHSDIRVGDELTDEYESRRWTVVYLAARPAFELSTRGICAEVI